MKKIFDSYIIVDWSAAAKPTTGADSIWVGTLTPDARFNLSFHDENIPTRAATETYLRETLTRLTKRGDRVLLGFDFPLGYPQGFADALNLKGDGPAWARTHTFLAKEMKDKPDNSNNRFPLAARLNRLISNGPFPFWGCSKRDEITTLTVKKSKEHGEGDLPEYREAELAAIAQKKGRPQSVWKLAYTGAVGSQALTGIPVVNRLRNDFENMRIWPFETAFEIDDEVQIVVSEVYPSMLKSQSAPGETKDLAQVRTLATHFAELDTKGALTPLFSPKTVDNPVFRAKVVEEEGWILGIS